MATERIRLRAAGIDPSGAKESLAQRLGTGMAPMVESTRAAFNLNIRGLGTSLEEQVGRLGEIAAQSGTGSAAFMEALQESAGVARAAGSQMQIGEEGAVAFLMSQLSGVGISETSAMNALRKQQGRMNQLFQDPGRQSLRRFVDRLQSSEGTSLRSAATREDIRQFFEMGGESLYIGDERFTKEEMGKISDEQLKGLTKLDLAVRGEYYSASGEMQSVKIHNLIDLSRHIAEALYGFSAAAPAQLESGTGASIMSRPMSGGIK